MAKLTIQDIIQAKGKRQLAQVHTRSAEESSAAEAAGVDIICVYGHETAEMREAAPNTFIVAATGGGEASDYDAIKIGMEPILQGADAVYTSVSPTRHKAMAQEKIPSIGHVGLVPNHRVSWYGGFRAVGKTVEEAMTVYRDTMAYQDAGAIGVECEVVPHEIAREISKRVKISLISMGAGSGCDIQYLFACDILGLHDDHYPRHSKVYRKLKPEFERIQKERIEAFKEYTDDVHTGAYPEQKHIVDARPEVLEEFVKILDSE
jgi:3-methyl-2-oxobutanoate hydroxymethyltransferase